MSALPRHSGPPAVPLRLAQQPPQRQRVRSFRAVDDLHWPHGSTGGPDADPALFAAHGAAVPRCLCDVTVFRDDAPVAMILARRAHRRLRCRLGYLALRTPALKCLDIVHGGLLDDGTPRARAALRAELEQRLTSGAVDLVTINHLGVDHPLYAALADGSALGAIAGSVHREPHWSFALEGRNPGDIVTGLSKKHRNNVRRSSRQLERAGGALSIVTDAHALPRLLSDGRAVTGRSYQGALGAGLGHDPAEEALLTAAAGRGQLFGAILRVRDTPIAFQSGVIVNDVFHLRSTAFDPAWAAYSPGQLLLVRVLERLAERRLSAIDYGFGDADYKRAFGNRCVEEATLRLFGCAPRARAAWALHTGMTRADRVLRRGAERVGIARRARHAWRAWLARKTPPSPRSTAS